MHIGFSSMNNPADPSPTDLAVALEERGFESLWYGEHSHIPCAMQTPYPGGGDMPDPYRHIADPYVSLMAAASVTSTLKLGTGIALIMERDIFSQAKTIATLDRLSNGRVLLGVGVGWNEEEFANVNPSPWNKRFGVMRETVAAMRALWTQEQAEYHGNYINFDPVWCSPKPQQENGPPVIYGVMGPLGIKHATAIADGWMPADVGLPQASEQIAAFRQMVRETGRDPDDVPITVQAMLTPDIDKLREFEDLGVVRVNVGVAVDMWDKPDEVMPLIDRFGDIIAKL
jgi:probable F420-dependent oxidoreductase